MIPSVNLLRRGLVLAVMVAAWVPARADEPLKAVGADLPDPVRAAVHAAIQKVYPALVRIHVVTTLYADGREIKREAFGSGVIISAQGHVITNHHVAGKTKRIRCTLATKEELEATLIGSDPLADIAVLQLKLDGRPEGSTLAVAQFGDSDRLRVGDHVLAMGSPRALAQSVTRGIVSNRELTLSRVFAAFRLDGEEVGSLVKWIGHDAQIFPGNSGGPLVNLDGQIVGINDIGVGLGGAIPGNLARDVADELIRYGEVRRSWLGVTIQPLLKSNKLEQGVLVGGVLPGSPAEKAGLKAGDVLLRFNGKAVAPVRYAEQLPEFNRLVLSTPVGSTVELVYERDGQRHQASAQLVARGRAEGPEAEFKSWGLTAQELPLLAAKQIRREPYAGLLVTSVRPGGGAAEAKPAVQTNDLIVDVEGKPVRTLHDLEAVTSERQRDPSQPATALVGFERGRRRLLTVVKLGERDTPDRSADASRAWLPIETQVLTPDLAKALGLAGRKGVRVTEVYAEGAAARAGLQVGDILLRLDGDPIEAARPEDAEMFAALIRQYRIGSKVKLEGLRQSQPLVVEVELEATPRSTRQVGEYRDTRFEFRARDLIFQDRVLRELPPDQKGAVVTAVDNGGWAALGQLRVGDLVLAVDGQPVHTVADLRRHLQEVEKARPATVVFFVRRDVHTLFVELEPAWPAK
jgi:serine protease Do